LPILAGARVKDYKQSDVNLAKHKMKLKRLKHKTLCSNLEAVVKTMEGAGGGF
jgi:hypothetical protein